MSRIYEVLETTFTVLRVALALVMVYAGSLKITTPDQFAEAIERYHLVPPLAAAAVATFLPWFEIVVGLALFVPRLQPGAAAAALGLSLLFVAALSSAWIRNLDVDCGCFGPAASTSGLAIPIFRALGLSFGAAFLFYHLTRLHAEKLKRRNGD